MIVKAGDTHAVQWRASMDLTGATVRLVAKQVKAAPVVLEARVEDGKDGLVSHTLTGDLPNGTYSVELEATLAGEIITFPNSGHVTLTVAADID